MVLSIETEPVLPTLSTFVLIVAPISREPTSIYQSAIANALFVSDGGVHCRSSVGLSGERSGTAYASTTYDILRHSGSRLPYRAQAHTSPPLAYNHSALSFPSPLNVPRCTFCLDEYGVVAGLTIGAVWLFSLLSFLCLEVSVERCKPSHFSCYKGRTDRSAQNRHTDFCNNFIKNGTSLIFDRASLKILLKFLLRLTFSVLPIIAT